MNDVSIETPSPEQPHKLTFEFRGDGSEYFKIWIVNILLTILTLGIYSAWATVRNNRYFHSNLYLDNNNFSYLAEPMQILKGRLIAVAAFIVYMLCLQFVPVLGIILAIALVIAIPYFTNKSLEFKHRMSAYKNIQFRFKATYGEAAMVLFVWPVVGVLTLGILYPLAILKMNQYLVKNSTYGTSKFDFSATFENYGKIFLTMIGIGIVASIAMGTIAFIGGDVAKHFIPLLMIPAYFGLLLFFITKMHNLFFNSLSLVEHKFTADITMAGLAKVLLTNALLMMITLGLYAPAAKVRMVKYISSCIVMDAQDDLGNFVAAEKENVSALGEEFAQVFDFA